MGETNDRESASGEPEQHGDGATANELQHIADDVNAGVAEDGRLERDVAVDVAYASKEPNSTAAYARQVADLGRRYRSEKPRLAGDMSYEDLEAQEVAHHERAKTELDELNAAYPEAGRGRFTDLRGLSNEIADEDAEKQAVENEGGQYYPQRGPQRLEAHAAKRAARIEDWAEALYNNPVAPEGFDAQRMVDIEAQLEEMKSNLEYARRNAEHFAKNRDTIPAGRLDSWAVQIVGSFPDNEADYSPLQRQWLELSRSDTTTVAQLKDFLTANHEQNVASRAETIGRDHERIEAIRNGRQQPSSGPENNAAAA